VTLVDKGLSGKLSVGTPGKLNVGPPPPAPPPGVLLVVVGSFPGPPPPGLLGVLVTMVDDGVVVVGLCIGPPGPFPPPPPLPGPLGVVTDSV
jgi:hypothetical protein